MKDITMFHLNSCPYCREARKWMEEVLSEHPEYASIPLKMIEEREQKDIADQYDYYYVPTYYIDDVKVHEGAATKKIVESVFEKAYSG